MPKSFSEIPLTRPDTPLLDRAPTPDLLRQMEEKELRQLADELREYLLYSVGKTGGHFGAGLGVVELTTALHYIYDTPHDRLVWDVGHQTYPHKILTGRREQMQTLRQRDGLAGFPKREESEYDTFGVGHSSTSISAALGMALAYDLSRKADEELPPRKHVAVIGDGAMTAGMAFEALNHAADSRTDLLVVLNDNQMSISENVGGLSTYFSKIWASKLYNRVRKGGQQALSKIPPASEFVRRAEEHLKGLISPGTLFEEIGYNYIGPIDGHNLPLLVETLSNLRTLEEPTLLHVITQKGRGFEPAEADPIKYHALSKLEPVPAEPKPTKPSLPKYQDIFGDWLCTTAEVEPTLIAITPAMREGSGMVEFSKQFPKRYIDVGIAEQHSVTLAAGVACEGLKPVVAIYSTFLQRGYDQLIHDVALQNLDVTFAMDRAGLVGEDGPSHAGSFDIAYLRCVPNLVIATPSDENETWLLLNSAYQHPGPAAVRYPRGTGPGTEIERSSQLTTIGKGLVRRQGSRVAILAFGVVLEACLQAAKSIDATVADMRFAKPLDEELIRQLADSHDLLVTVEEGSVAGGAGSAVSEYLSSQNLQLPIHHLGLPDRFIDQGTRTQLLAEAGLDADSITNFLNSIST